MSKKKSRGHCISKIVKWCGASRPLCGGMRCGIAPPFKSVSAAFPLNLQWCGSSRFFSQLGCLKNTSVTSIGNPWNAVSGQSGQQQLNCEWPLTTSCENLHKQSCTTRVSKRDLTTADISETTETTGGFTVESRCSILFSRPFEI